MCSQVSFSFNTMMQCSLARGGQQSLFPGRRMSAEIPFRRIDYNTREIGVQRSFLEGSRVVLRPQVQRIISNPKGSLICASLITSSQIASTAFTWGTVVVLPFYALMVLVPKSTLTRRVMDSNIPFAALAILYGYLLYLSWTPSTLNVIFATKYLLPELPGMAKMFANEKTMASAWIHLLVVDLYAARQVFLDGLKSNVETRHSVTLCLLSCPIGILTHVITKLMMKIANGSH
ncbi:protein ABA DEFICIENT 4, chloroplastic isoform X2 [Dendrobium catenatum]|uniref:Protein ABA DEFICIENT 4, chloroplastic n=1 Tax=Dendrobium catenatum TaxID=906689 RepID=A0A2I0VDH4_9ASPA|nr:protein ABA DEFICIENT 4, chloroplastic isoform X2 [Dendrobium catenatum]PKU61458.1 hypothetical protein MA16_Dca019694 [Dendrobium catenatum]